MPRKPEDWWICGKNPMMLVFLSFPQAMSTTPLSGIQEMKSWQHSPPWGPKATTYWVAFWPMRSSCSPTRRWSLLFVDLGVSVEWGPKRRIRSNFFLWFWIMAKSMDPSVPHFWSPSLYRFKLCPGFPGHRSFARQHNGQEKHGNAAAEGRQPQVGDDPIKGCWEPLGTTGNRTELGRAVVTWDGPDVAAEMPRPSTSCCTSWGWVPVRIHCTQDGRRK